MDLRDTIRTIPDYPKPGIMFRDVSTLLGNPAAYHEAIEQMSAPYRGADVSKVAGIDARGFILGGAIAHVLGAGFLPLRKPGKLPFETINEPYELEYGSDALHLHVDGVHSGERILLVDDLIATGGTAEAGVKPVHRAGGTLVGGVFLVDLPDLGGAHRLRAMDVDVRTLISFEGH